jgi:hypothetical protein
MKRQIEIGSDTWAVAPAGRVTQYFKDEFGLVFTKGTGAGREERVVRYSPRGSRYREFSLQELSTAQLVSLFHRSQPSWTSPETEYRR